MFIENHQQLAIQNQFILPFLLMIPLHNLGAIIFSHWPLQLQRRLRVECYIKLSSPGYYRFGLSKGTETAVYSIDTFAIQNTYLCVLKYQFNTVSTRDDSLKLFVFSDGMPASEPSTALVETMGGTSTDATSISKIVLTQGDAATSPSVYIDGIRMANSWDKLNASSLVNPYPVSAITTVASSTSTATISWTKPYNFDSTSMKTLVFVKPTSAITQGAPTYPSSYYAAQTNFLLASSRYQNDYCRKMRL
jgi:hypothetical protein